MWTSLGDASLAERQGTPYGGGRRNTFLRDCVAHPGPRPARRGGLSLLGLELDRGDFDVALRGDVSELGIHRQEAQPGGGQHVAETVDAAAYEIVRLTLPQPSTVRCERIHETVERMHHRHRAAHRTDLHRADAERETRREDEITADRAGDAQALAERNTPTPARCRQTL